MVMIANNRLAMRMSLCLKLKDILYHILGGGVGSKKEGALAARVFVGAKGSSNLPPRAQRYIWAGQIAALAGYDAVLVIGFCGKNLRGSASAFLPGEVGQFDIAAGS